MLLRNGCTLKCTLPFNRLKSAEHVFFHTKTTPFFLSLRFPFECQGEFFVSSSTIQTHKQNTKTRKLKRTRKKSVVEVKCVLVKLNQFNDDKHEKKIQSKTPCTWHILSVCMNKAKEPVKILNWILSMHFMRMAMAILSNIYYKNYTNKNENNKTSSKK